MTSIYNTDINVIASREECRQIIDVLNKLETKELPIYLYRVELDNGEEKIRLQDLKNDEAIESFISKSDGSIDIDAWGPWGDFWRLKESRIFEIIADAAPGASFVGKVDGDTSYSTESIECELKNGILHLESFYEANDDEIEKYYEYVKNIMPYERFLDVFRVDSVDFGEYDYDRYLSEPCDCDSFLRENYVEFKKGCPGSEISKDEYYSLKAQMSKEGLDYDTFLDGYEGGHTEVYDYDPVNHKYLDV